ncbi:DUF3558 family protein [Rhodococcoides yunnanense]|uniref:DUF3558 family protein n=1 Tax=Rhodococcoides yunnanense TaxID=278209 RepID=UPI0009FEFF27|nr:DUF3558 family protein [Rhodococcus yunnanensis]
MQRRGVAILAAIVLVTGCGRGIDGTPVAGIPAEPWDPCTIPAQAIEATGLDPKVADHGWGAGISVPDWARCTWKGPQLKPWYFFGVLFSQVHTLDEVRDRPGNSGLADLRLADRDAILFFSNILDKDENCSAAFETKFGVAWLTVDAIGSTGPMGEPCTVLKDHVADLIDHFPPPL